MDILESIQTRKSGRTYTGQSIDPTTIKKIETYVNNLEAPFDAKCRIEVIHTDNAAEPIQLGTYGFIKGASTYLALIIEEGVLAEEGAAYIFEQAVLYCTSLGLGTCWLGVSFKKNTFKKQLNLKSGETLRIVSPIGYVSEKRHLSLFILFGSTKSYKRKPFSANFFDQKFGIPLTEEKAGIYSQSLEMVRLAPSANNKQPWRVVLEKSTLHFYKSSSYGFDAIDLGIALCHFEQTCHELNITGHFEVLDNTPIAKKATYAISWVIK